MILFFVGIIEMVIAAFWTKAVSKANVAVTGMITTVNIFIWYYVIRQVVDTLDAWYKIVPYVAGCAIGAMLGSTNALEDLARKARRMVMHAVKRAPRGADRPAGAPAIDGTS